jgi:hypothetical protein
MPLLSLLAFGLICWLSWAATIRAAEPSPTAAPRIWSGLILATNGAHPGQPPEHLRNVAGKLKNIFGYNQFEIVGEYSEKMGDANERWLVPSKDFYMSVQSGTGPGGNHPMKIVLFQNRKRLAELEAHLGPDSPLFIRGPQYAHGQLVIVLRVAEPSEFAVHEPKPAILATNPSPILQPKEKQRSNPPPPPPPAPLLAPIPKEKFNPQPPDRFGPLPGDRPGDIDSKLGRP